MATKKYKMSDPSRCFYDEVSGLYLSGDREEEITNFTPKTQEWIRNGGIVEVEPTKKVKTSKPEEQTQTVIPPATTEGEEQQTEQQVPGDEEEQSQGEEEEETTKDTDGGLDALLGASTSKKDKKK